MARDAKQWLQEIEKSRSDAKDYFEQGKRVFAIYEADKKEEVPFNVLYSNTEVLHPALYSSTPQPDVQRRFRDEDPLGGYASRVSNRVLSYQIDTNVRDYPTFDEVMGATVLDALLPGRGVSRVVYHAEKNAQGLVGTEAVCVDHVQWDKFAHGYARSWKGVPWVAFATDMTLADMKARFGAKVPVTFRIDGLESADKPSNENDPKQQASGTLPVWQVWDKRSKTVYTVVEGVEDFLEKTPDPYGLSGFFPMEEPIQLFARSNSLIPVALYRMYEKQADELNRVCARLNKVLEAIRVRGAYDSTLDEVKRVLDAAGDNELVPVQNARAFIASNGSFDKAIWLMPIDMLIGVAKELYTAREQIKAVIYEITGISDLMRNQTAASESATAQNLKDKWGTLRLKRYQKKVASHVRGTLRIMLELSVNKLSPQTLEGMTNVKLPTPEQVQQSMAQWQQAAMVAQQQGQQPPPQPQLPPTWADVLGLLKNTLLRSWRVDIETNSTVDVDATTEKQEVTEFMMAMQQMFSGLQAAVQGGMMDVPTAKSLLLAVVRRFRFGREVEEQIAAMQPGQGQGAAEEAQKQQAALQKAKEQVQTEQNKAKDLLAQLEQAKMELKYQEQINQLREQLRELQLQQQVATAQSQLSAEGTSIALQKKDVEHANSKFQEAHRESQRGAQVQVQAAKQMQQTFQQLANALVQTQQTNQVVMQQVGQAMAAVAQLAETMSQEVEAVPQPDGSWRRRRVPKATVQ